MQIPHEVMHTPTAGRQFRFRSWKSQPLTQPLKQAVARSTHHFHGRTGRRVWPATVNPVEQAQVGLRLRRQR